MPEGLIPELPSKPRAPKFTWDPSLFDGKGGYVNALGVVVPFAEVRKELDVCLYGMSRLMRGMTEKLVEGEISLADWHIYMLGEIKETHMMAAAAATGGWEQMTFSDYGRVGQRIREEYDYLRDFTKEIEEGVQKLTGAVPRRAAMYGQAGRETFTKFEQKKAEIAGHDEERSKLNPAEHCDQCVEEARKGWVPLGALVPIGQRTCLTNCRCDYETRFKPGGRAQAHEIWQIAREQGGITYDPIAGQAETSGNAVALYPDATDVLDLNKIKDPEVDAALAKFINRNMGLFADPETNARLGLFVDERNKLWFDISELTKTQETAMNLAREAMQNSFFNLDNLDLVQTGVTLDEAEQYAKLLDAGNATGAALLKSQVLARILGK